MKKFLILAFATVASATIAGASQGLLVKVRDGAQMSAAFAHMAAGVSSVDRIGAMGVDVVRLAPNADAGAAMAFYRSLPFVEYVEADATLRAFETPNDPYVGTQWHLEKVHAPQAWDLDQGMPGVMIAIVDTGVQLNHPDLAAKMVEGWDFVNNDSQADDDHGHGTHCAGIAAAATNNEIGVAGLGYNCRVMPIKVLDANGSGSTSNVALGVLWAVDHGAKVVSMSLGGSSNSLTLQDAVDYAWNHGVLVVAAAGNSGSSSYSYPGAYANAIGVGASAPDDSRASFSNYGSWVDVAAPGTNILSSYLGGTYAYMSGTSMATPLVAGEAGLIWSHMGLLTDVSFIRQRLESSCDPIGDWNAHGRINAESALSENNPPPPPPDPTEFAPLTATLTKGVLLAGSSSNLDESDDLFWKLGPVSTRRSGPIECLLEFNPVLTGTETSVTVVCEGDASQQMFVSSAFYNFRRKRWTPASRMLVKTTSVTAELAMPKPYADYRNADGIVRVKLSNTAPKAATLEWNRFTLTVVRP